MLIYIISILFFYLFPFYLKFKNKFVLFLITLKYFSLQQVILLVSYFNNQSLNLDAINYYFRILGLNNFIYILIIAVIYFLNKQKINYKENYIYISKLSSSYFILLFFSMLILFLILNINSNFEFILNTRNAYQNFRAGNGTYWVLYILSISLITFCYLKKIFDTNLLIVILIMAFYYFTGAKKGIYELMYLIVILSVYRFGIKKIFKFKNLIIYLFGSFLVIGFLFGQYNSNVEFFYRFVSYSDSFLPHTERLFTDVINDNFDFFNGRIIFSTFLNSLPDFLYTKSESSPYGSNLLLNRYYPDLWMTGHTPSFGPLSIIYADFGILGILLNFISIETFGFFLIIYVFGINNFYSKFLNNIAIYIGLIPLASFHLPAIFFLIFFYIYIKFFHNKILIIDGNVK